MSEDLKQMADEIIDATKGISGGVHKLLEGEISIKVIWELLTALILGVEKIYDGIEGAGKEKHELVRQVWDELEARYGLIDKLDAAIKLPFWLEPFDKKILQMLIDVLISMIVTILNMTEGWLK